MVAAKPAETSKLGGFCGTLLLPLSVRLVTAVVKVARGTDADCVFWTETWTGVRPTGDTWRCLFVASLILSRTGSLLALVLVAVTGSKTTRFTPPLLRVPSLLEASVLFRLLGEALVELVPLPVPVMMIFRVERGLFKACFLAAFAIDTAKASDRPVRPGEDGGDNDWDVGAATATVVALALTLAAATTPPIVFGVSFLPPCGLTRPIEEVGTGRDKVGGLKSSSRNRDNSLTGRGSDNLAAGVFN